MQSKLLVLVFGLLACVHGAHAADNSSREEAVALIAKAQEYIKVRGLEAAFAEFNRLDSPFNARSPINPKGDLYLFSMDFSGFQAVHGKNPKIRGKVMMEMRDQNGVYLIREMVSKCRSAGKGWVEYVWPHPLTNVPEAKIGYVERIPGTDSCIGTGVYK